MQESNTGALSPEDAARLERWHAAGRPPVPLVIDGACVIHATTISLATVLAHQDERWEPFQRAARRWVDEHCPG